MENHTPVYNTRASRNRIAHQATPYPASSPSTSKRIANSSSSDEKASSVLVAEKPQPKKVKDSDESSGDTSSYQSLKERHDTVSLTNEAYSAECTFVENKSNLIFR